MPTSRKHLTVSVIVPAFNCARFVSAAIESALNQTRPPHEVVVVDDGSTDETPDIVRQFGSPVIAIRQPNGGLSAARNLAMRRSTGDALMFLDADDLLLPECIERSVRELECHPEVGVVYSDIRLIDENGGALGVYSKIYPGDRPVGMILGEVGYCWSMINPSSTIVRSTALDGMEFDLGLSGSAEDFEFWRRLSAKTQFFFLNEVLSCYRHHQSQITATRGYATQVGAIEVQRRLMAMPEFEQVSRSKRARLYCHHGVRNAMIGNGRVARKMFIRAVRAMPTYSTAYALLAISCLGDRALQLAIEKRRQVSIALLRSAVERAQPPQADAPSGLFGLAHDGGCRG